MKRFIYGFDRDNPAVCAQRLRRWGIDAIVAGSISNEAARILTDHGLRLYLCYGAHSLGGDFDNPSRVAIDAAGQPRRWFGSGCPSDEDLADARLTAALNAAQAISNLSGIFVDGARFASFASVEGNDAFFTCFCPRCMRRMGEQGFDAEAIRNAVLLLARKGSTPCGAAPLLEQWLQFREACVANYFSRFADAVHALSPDLAAGAFVFAHSLGRFVGQTARACQPLDIVSPMLYRAYPHDDGPACLGHEWAAHYELFGGDGALGALPSPAPADDLRANGFPPERIACEVAGMRAELGKGKRLMPILQIEDDRLGDSEKRALGAGANGVGFFMYGQAILSEP